MLKVLERQIPMKRGRNQETARLAEPKAVRRAISGDVKNASSREWMSRSYEVRAFGISLPH